MTDKSAIIVKPSTALALAEEYRFIRHRQRLRRGGAAAAGRAGMAGKREMAQTADGGCAGTGRHISPFFTAKAFHERGTDGSEMQVLRLICADKSNAEIGEILNIRVSTVKSHVSSVLSKLGVNRRSEARTAAKKLWLISEDQ